MERFTETYYNQPTFKDEHPETPYYRCQWCLEDTTNEDTINFDHTINGNICLGCLEDEDHQSMLSMNNYEYYVYKTRVLKSKPIEL